MFDFGGVLAEEGFHNGIAALAREQGLDPDRLPQLAMQAVYDSEFVLGRGTAGDFWALLRQRTGVAGDDAELTQRILTGFVLRPWMIRLVRDLRAQGYVTGILSDQTNWLDKLNQQTEFYSAFDHIYNSFYLGKGKRDPSIFEDIANDLHLAPHAILFVDDDKGNIDRARASGWLTLQFIDKGNFLVQLEKLLS
jgi:putative hydrolase of the HAD superfamily